MFFVIKTKNLSANAKFLVFVFIKTNPFFYLSFGVIILITRRQKLSAYYAYYRKEKNEPS